MMDGNTMKCTICHEGHTEPGHITTMLERDGMIVIIQEVPALVCDNCGEEYIVEEVASTALKQAEAAIASGARLEVRKFAA
jgi:YgiT-type zinc finger domain-containing protein